MELGRAARDRDALDLLMALPTLSPAGWHAIYAAAAGPGGLSALGV